MAIVDSINSLATRVAQEFQTVRQELADAIAGVSGGGGGGGGGAGTWTLLGSQVGSGLNVLPVPDGKTINQWFGSISEIMLVSRDPSGGNVSTAVVPANAYSGVGQFALQVRRWNVSTSNEVIIAETYGSTTGTEIRVTGAVYNGQNYTSSFYYR